MSIQKSQPLRWLGHARSTLATLSMALGLCHSPLMAAAPSGELPVANFTPYNDAPTFVREHLSEDIQALVREERLAVFVLADAYEGKKACVALVGLTHLAPDGVNPRLPVFRFSAHAVEQEAAVWKASECIGHRLRAAIEGLNNAKPEKLLKDLERTAEGTRRVAEPATSDTVQLVSDNLSKVARDAVLEDLLTTQVGAVFDYRHVQTSIFSTSSTLTGGDIMCTVHAGMGARTPEGKNMRWPAQVVSMVRLQTGGTTDECIEVLAPQTVAALLKQQWTDQGLLKDFSKTREAGVPLPDLKVVAARRAAVLKKDAVAARAMKVTTVAKTVSRNELTCTNDCQNGACVRTFPNGRKEKWYPPRAYNPMTQNWEWDTSTKACGG